jgi:transposase
MGNKSYDLVFKENAIRLANDSEKNDRTVEKELGLYQGALRTWRREREKKTRGSFSRPHDPNDKDGEIRRLKKELANAQLERDILKKAVAIFSATPRLNSGL